MEQKWPNELIIFRHGQSDRNVAAAAAKKTGSTADYSQGVRDQDTKLTSVGLYQAEETGRRMRSLYPEDTIMRLDTLLVSPYLRTKQSAERFVFGLGYQPEIVIEERLREIEFGIMDGLTREGMRAKFPEEIRRKEREGKYWYRAPGGENRPDVRLRVHSVLGTLNRDYRKKRVAFWTHSVVVLSSRSLLERWGEHEYMAVDKENDVKNCSITRYLYNPGTGKLDLQEYNTILYDEAKGQTA